MVKVLIGTNSKNELVHIDLNVLRETRLLIQAVSRAGKSWLIRRLLERSWGEVQQIVLDIEGEYPSLADVYGHLILSAEEIERVGASELAGKIREHRISVILDLSDADRERQAVLATGLLRGLVDCPEEHWSSALVTVDEAHILAPLGASAGTPDQVRKDAIAALTDLMARGSKRGLIGVVATQRLAKIAKSVISEAYNVIIGRNNLDLDVNRASDALGIKRSQGDKILRRLEPGDFLAVGPAVSDLPTKVRVGPVESDHAGKSPNLDRPPMMAVDEAEGLIAAMPTVETSPAAGQDTRHWSDDEIEKLIEGWESGRPRREVAQELNRTVTACYQMINKLGVSGKAPAREDVWTDQEKDVVRQGYAEGLTQVEILQRLPDPSKRSVSGVARIAGELGLKSTRFNEPWTETDIARLRELVDAGTEKRECARILGRTVGAISSICNANGIYFLKPWKPEDFELLKKRHGEGVRLVDVAAEIGRPYANVAKVAERMKLSFKPSTQERQPKSNRPVVVTEKQLLELAGNRHEVCRTAENRFIVDRKYTYDTGQLVALVNRERVQTKERPVKVAGRSG